MFEGKSIFVTGATGFLGSQFVATMMEKYRCDIYCLVRPARTNNPLDRVIATTPLQEVTQPKARLVAIAGDIRKDNLGMAAEEYAALSQKIDYVVHIAANVNFLASLESLRVINVNGTRNALSFAKLCAQNNAHFKQFMHVSTAYVSGATNRFVLEEISSKEPAFRNNYECSKWEAEHVVSSESDGIPYTIVRPSTIVGNSKTGRADKSNVLFAPLAESLRHEKKNFYIACALRGRLDVVSVDYVADCMLAILQEPVSDKSVYHLTSGLSNQQPIKNFFKIVRSIFAIRFVALPFWTYRLFFKPLMKWRNSKEDVRLLRVADAYLSYLGYGPQFDTQNTDAVIKRTEIVRPESNLLVETVLKYAKETNFAKS